MTLHPSWRPGRLRHARVAALVALLLVGSGRPGSAQQHDTLVVATYAYPSVDRAGAIGPLAEVLRARLGRPIRVLVVPDPVALVTTVREARADVAVTNTFGYLLLASEAPVIARAIATFRVPSDVRTQYGTVLVTRAALVPELRTVASVARHIADLRVGLVGPGSTTGNLVPRLILASHGVADLDARARTVAYAGTHAAAFALLRDRNVDVAAMAAEEFDRQLAALPAVDRARYRVVWQSPDILLGPVVVRAGLPAPIQRAIADAVIGLEQHAPAAFAALRDGWTEARRADGLVSATDATYDPVRRLFGQRDALRTLLHRHAR